MLKKVREVLFSRAFTEKQVEAVIPTLQREFIEEPKYLGEIIDTWNQIMGSARVDELDYSTIPPTASPSQNSIIEKQGLDFKVDMNYILAELEPRLLKLCPDKLLSRHRAIQGLMLSQNQNENWLLLFNAPRGFYLQDWVELTKRIYYLEHKVIELLYDKKQLKEMDIHPIAKAAASVELDFDHIRTRYLFADRVGYKTLSHLYPVQKSTDTNTLKDLLLADDISFLKKFAPFCSGEEYITFSNLVKKTELDEDDAELFQKYAELDVLDRKKIPFDEFKAQAVPNQDY